MHRTLARTLGDEEERVSSCNRASVISNTKRCKRLEGRRECPWRARLSRLFPLPHRALDGDERRVATHRSTAHSESLTLHSPAPVGCGKSPRTH
ncbi:RHTO0S02e02498g1_1 [Rhodotorula toruloides]|uniref:RHTO0S02e02498g1_1 n=2 Tax=Rhodotorula toruloides TaxID=5286 RepID=A0A061AG22_RHOTO|nr:uncharacterized protein RHTO_01258 [Rhodotorula toruloides NP11]EMS22043.1 hypothetical protein RHTO_01258 [Rhodotorula toruloides NP11]CDR36460.1 RHTO0S02e02498g1_1 [Rhodotorula toruloides]